METFHANADCLESWMGDMETDPDLAEILSEFVHKRGLESMEAICFGRPSHFSALALKCDRRPNHIASIDYDPLSCTNSKRISAKSGSVSIPPHPNVQTIRGRVKWFQSACLMEV